MILLPSPPHHCQPQHPLLVLLIEQCSILTSNTSVSMSNPAMQIFGLVMSSITIPFCHLLPHLTKFQKHQVKTTSKFPLTPLGVLAPGSAHARPSARPPFDMSAKKLRRTCLQSHLQTSPPTPQKSYRKFQNPSIVLGVGGVPDFF